MDEVINRIIIMVILYMVQIKQMRCKNSKVICNLILVNKEKNKMNVLCRCLSLNKRFVTI